MPWISSKPDGNWPTSISTQPFEVQHLISIAMMASKGTSVVHWLHVSKKAFLQDYTIWCMNNWKILACADSHQEWSAVFSQQPSPTHYN
jgi:hypothetical protein